jgi:thiol-disulfide isomerase/thioredoxin
MTAKKVTCQFHSSGARTVTLSICDDKKTFCKQQKVSLEVQKAKSKNPKINQSPTLSTLKMQKDIKEKLMKDFKVMTTDEAVQAISMKNAALVMVSADWCPPCNYAKEFLLQTEDFKKATKDLLLIYVDGDSPNSKPWIQKLKTFFYPSFVVLNKDLKVVSVSSEISSDKFIKFLNKGISNLDDPISDLNQRLAQRNSGSLLRKAKDFFKADKSLQEDKKRQLEYLLARGKFKEVLSNIKNIEDKDLYKAYELDSKFYVSMFGDKDVIKDKTLFHKEYLDQNPDDMIDYLGVLKEFCEDFKKDKTSVSSECLDYINSYKKYLQSSVDHKKGVDSLAEKEHLKMRLAVDNASLAEITGDIKASNKFYKECRDSLKSLFKYSPLKEKSRTLRMTELSCVKDKSKKIALLKDLAKDYPYESTFHTKLFYFYKKNKDVAKALESNQKALDFSYGSIWLNNVNSRVNYLIELNRNKEALELADKTLNEVELSKNDLRTERQLKALRRLRQKVQKI